MHALYSSTRYTIVPVDSFYRTISAHYATELAQCRDLSGCAATLDVAFVEGPVDPDGLLVVPWRRDELMVIAPPDHPLVHTKTVALADLLAEPFVLREQGSGTREVIEAALRDHGVTLRIPLELGSTEAIKRAVAAGMGLAIVSQATVTSELVSGQLCQLAVPELTLTRQLTRLSVVGRPLSPALQTWLTWV